MIEFLHAADLHLDSPLRGLDRHEDAPVDAIRRATRKAFKNLVAVAIDRRVAFVVLAGDIFDGNRPDMNSAQFFRNRLSELIQNDIPVILLHGNHDADNAITVAGGDPPDGVHRLPADRPRTVILTTADGSVALHGQSFAQAAETRNLAAGYPSPRVGHLNIGVLHTALDGKPGHAPYAPCSLSDLTGKGYDYWALGHIHAREVVRRDPWIVYPGNLQGRHVGETGPKGACLVTVKAGRVVDAEFIDLDVFRWFDVTVDVAGAGDMDGVLAPMRAAVSAAVTAAGDRAFALRLRLAGATPLHDRLVRDPVWLHARMVDAATDLAGQRMWLESLQLKTEPLAGTHAIDPGAGDALLAVLEEIRADPAELAAVLRDSLGDLTKRIAPDAPAADPVRALADPESEAADRLCRAAIGLIVDRGGLAPTPAATDRYPAG